MPARVSLQDSLDRRLCPEESSKSKLSSVKNPTGPAGPKTRFFPPRHDSDMWQAAAVLVVLVGANAAILSDASKLRLHHRDSTACQRQLRANANTNAEEQPRARYRVCGNINYSSICKDTLRCMHSLRTSNREKNLTFSGGATLRENEHNESHCVVSCCQCFKKPCESYCAWHKIDEHLQQIKRHVQEEEGEEEEDKIYSSKLLTDITLATQTTIRE